MADVKLSDNASGPKYGDMAHSCDCCRNLILCFAAVMSVLNSQTSSVSELIHSLKDLEKPILDEQPSARRKAIQLCESLLTTLESPEEYVVRLAWTEVCRVLWLG